MDKKEDKQFDLELKYSKLEPLYKFKRFSQGIEKKFTVLPFWRNGIIWLTICTISATFILLMAINIKYYYKLPPQIPLLYDIQNERWTSYSKIFVWTIPFLVGFLGLLNLQFLRKVYYMNKDMTLAICLFLAAACVLVVLSVNELYIVSIV